MQQNIDKEGIRRPSLLVKEWWATSILHRPQVIAKQASDLAGNLAKAHLAHCSRLIFLSFIVINADLVCLSAH